MNEQVQKVVKTVTQFWESQDKKRRILYIAMLVAIVLIAVIVTILLNKKDYIVLYEGLETTEASEMVSLIEEMGYEARLSGGTIMVEKGTENDIVMQLAMQQYPKNKQSYTYTVEQTGMFTTDEEYRTNYLIDMQNRLSEQISSLETISGATVNLTAPEQKNTVIQELRQYPTAAITVYLDGIDKLSNKQIAGITNLVKMSWSGLTDENISIVDGYGIPQIIDTEADYDVIVQETKKLAFKTNLENSIKEKILELLVPVYNEDGVSVAVNMLLDFDNKVSENTDYSADGNNNTGVLAHADADNASGGTTADGGVVGVEYNADDTYPTGDTNGNGAWTENSLSNTYLVDTYKEQVEKVGYDVEGISIAVIIYTDYLSEDQKLDLVRLVGNSGTVNPEIVEDVVTVTNFPKLSDIEDADANVVPVYLFGLTFDQLILVGAIILIILLIIFIVLAILSGNAKKKRKAFEQQVIEASSIAADGEGGEPTDMFVFGEGGEPIEIPSLMDDQIETKEVVIRREISEFAKNSPEIVAQLLKTWMKEDGDT